MLSKADFMMAAVFFLLALGASYFAADGRPLLGPDSAFAVHVGQNLASGEGLVHRVAGDSSIPKPQPMVTKPPLFATLIAALTGMGVASKTAGWAIVYASFAFAAAMLYLIARLALPVAIAALVVVLFTASAPGLLWSITLHEEWLFIALSFASLLILSVLRERAQHSHNGWWALLGVVTGAALLASYQGFPLVLTVGAVLLFDGARNSRSWRHLGFYVLGLTAIGIYPLVRFANLWAAGVKPSFDLGGEPTWLAISAGLIHVLQNDFLGRLVVWLGSASPGHIAVLVASYVSLGLLLAAAARHKALVPASLYVAVYVLLLIFQLAGGGRGFLEPRVVVPVEALLLLVVTAVLWRLAENDRRLLRAGALAAGLLGVALYANAQYHGFRKIAGDGSAARASREYCPSPQTLAWVKGNIPPGAVILSTQCGYQLLADASEYYWVAIPPADEYASSPRFHERWGEADFLRVSVATGAKWAVILLGERGDPLRQKPGYGAFVDRLLAGEAGTQRVRRVVKFSDGAVYSIE
ncbi:MAG: glycosyltransferase family 39 protein [Pseudomonadota bacterium]